MSHRSYPRAGILGALALALALALVAALLPSGLAASGGAAAQPPPAVVTAVTNDGTLWMLPEIGPPQLMRGGLAPGATVTDIAWHPARPELLMVRQVWRSVDGGREPYDTLVSLDLTTGRERVLQADVGPEARISHPGYGPGGAWAYAQASCCLSSALVVYNADGSQRQQQANTFLAPAQREDTLARVGPLALDGRILMSLQCCFGPTPADNPAGIYLVDRDLSSGQRVARTDGSAEAVGLGPGGWVGVVQTQPADQGPAPVGVYAIDMADNSTRTLLSPGVLPIASRGAMAPDGMIVVGTRPTDEFPVVYGDLWLVRADGQRRNLTNGAIGGITAFTWAIPFGASPLPIRP